MKKKPREDRTAGTQRQPEISGQSVDGWKRLQHLQIIAYRNPFKHKIEKQGPFIEVYDWLQQRAANQQKIEKQKPIVHELKLKYGEESLQYQSAKNTLAKLKTSWCIMIGGVCRDGEHSEAAIVSHTWIAFHDIDGIWNRQILEQAFEILKARWRHALIIERSISRTGIHIFTLTTATDEKQFLATWWAIQRQLKFLICQLGSFTFDESTSQASKLCFASGDPDAHRNPNAEAFQAVDPLLPKASLPNFSWVAHREQRWTGHRELAEQQCGVAFLSDFELDEKNTRPDTGKANIKCPNKNHRRSSNKHAVLYSN
jgi:hypothetical protein